MGVLKKLRRREFSAVAMASVVLAPDLALSAVNPQKVSIALAAKTSLFHLPLVLAEQLGAFKNEGLQIDWLECESGLQAVHLAAFVLQGRAPQISVGLATRKALTMKSLDDLKSVKIGISSLGSGTHWVAQQWLLKAKLAAEKVQFVELGSATGQLLEAVKTGSVDALCHTDPVMHYLEQKNELRLLAETRSLLSSQRMFGGPMLSACLFGKGEFLQKRTDVALTLTRGVVKALQWLKTAGPSDILKMVPSHNWMGDRAIYLGALENVRNSYSLDGMFSTESLQTAWRARASRVSTDRANWTTLAKTYTNEFALIAQRKVNS
jgi:NitT/TauT family transport system substrate-binding protein